MSDFVEALRAAYGTRPFLAEDVIKDLKPEQLPAKVQRAIVTGSKPVISLGKMLAATPGLVLADQNGKHGKLWQVKP
jgi:hypothetical protein